MNSQYSLDDYHMTLCIKDRVKEMTNPTECMAYMAGRVYEMSKTNPQVASTTMDQIQNYCANENLQYDVAFYADLCKNTNLGYSKSFQKHQMEKNP